MSYTNGIVHTLERKQGIGATVPQRHTGLRAAAEGLSRRNADAAVIELMSEALSRLVALAYETDGGGLCNVDAPTGKVLIALPWGRAGHQRWGLRPSEATVLREIMLQRQYAPGLFVYHALGRAWHVNRHDYPSTRVALAYLERYPLTIAEYRSCRAKRLGSD
jgi:hypothetical protein